jgi:hypothetical protein
MLKSFVSCAAVAALSCGAIAQSFNIDVGNATPTPANAYGAGSGQTGFWNTYIGGTLPSLINTSGSATGVSMTGTGGFLGSYNDPGTFGDDEALIDDLLSVPFLETYTINGLAPGNYNVYTYVWTFNALPTDIQVNGLGYQTVGGAWTGSFVQGQTHSLHNLTLTTGQPVTIDIHTVNGALGGMTGVQIVPVPTPGAAAVLVGAGVLGMRRRRR